MKTVALLVTTNLLLVLVIKAQAQNDETKKIFNEGFVLSDEFINTPICILAEGNKKGFGDEFMYTNDFVSELRINDHKKFFQLLYR